MNEYVWTIVIWPAPPIEFDEKKNDVYNFRIFRPPTDTRYYGKQIYLYNTYIVCISDGVELHILVVVDKVSQRSVHPTNVFDMFSFIVMVVDVVALLLIVLLLLTIYDNKKGAFSTFRLFIIYLRSLPVLKGILIIADSVRLYLLRALDAS